jgi:hypothetical protein
MRPTNRRNNTAGVPVHVIEHTLINCPLNDFYTYIDSYKDYFEMARILAKDGKIEGLRQAYINNEVYNEALDKILG